MSRGDRILVLGAFSWLGYLLLSELKITSPNCKLAGTTRQLKAGLGEEVELFEVINKASLNNALIAYQPTVIVNFLRGEDENGMLIHKSVIDYSKSNNSYYLYASSALALDGYSNTQLTEEFTAYGVSEYGVFKASCEQELYDAPIKWCVIRFASVQGFVPHKLTRNEFFLQKLISKEKVSVDRGVIQNRMLALLLIQGISKLISFKTEGIIHFGTLDSSEEFHFLKQQAEFFGFSPSLVLPGENRNVNLVTVPSRIFSILGNEFKIEEKDTLEGIVNIPQLQKYRQ